MKAAEIADRAFSEIGQALGVNVLRRRARSMAALCQTTPRPREWRVDGWVPNRQVTLLYGDGGLGKSLIGMQLQFDSAVGNNWLGLPTTQCRSIGFYCEDEQDELQRRLHEIREAAG